MISKPLIIFGSGEIASLAAFYFAFDGNRNVTAFTVHQSHRTSDSFEGKPLVNFEDVERIYPPSNYDAFIGVGYSRMNALRRDLCAAARAKGYHLASYISPRAFTFPPLQHGDNTFILEGNIVQPGVRIGNNVTLWGGSHIGHNSQIGDDVFIASHAVISGGVTIGRGTFMGVNAATRDHITIGVENLIGAGVTIMADTADYAVFRVDPEKPLPLGSNRMRWD